MVHPKQVSSLSKCIDFSGFVAWLMSLLLSGQRERVGLSRFKWRGDTNKSTVFHLGCIWLFHRYSEAMFSFIFLYCLKT